MVDLLEGIATTRAIRRFRPDPVSDDDLATLLFAATRAPSGSNRQPFRFIVLRDGPRAHEARAVLGRTFRAAWDTKRAADRYDEGAGDSPKARMARAMQSFVDSFEQVPVVILVAALPWRQLSFFEGASVYPACQNLLLAARAVGLGGVLSMWQAMAQDELRAVLGVPDRVVLAATIALGRPAGAHGPVRRRPLSELVYEDGWGEAPAWAADPPGTRFTSAGPGPRASHGRRP